MSGCTIYVGRILRLFSSWNVWRSFIYFNFWSMSFQSIIHWNHSCWTQWQAKYFSLSSHEKSHCQVAISPWQKLMRCMNDNKKITSHLTKRCGSQSSKEHKLLSFTFLTRFSRHIYDGRWISMQFSPARDLFSFFALRADEFLELWKDWLWTFFRSERCFRPGELMRNG